MAIQVNIYNQTGEKTGTQDLNPKIFGIEIKPQVVQQAIVAHQANHRQVLAHTKGKGDVSGGGRKPWKQKGTGRARHGSIRSPLWRGGGITFGPTNERNFSLKINKKAKRKALFMVLSDKVVNQKIMLLDNLELPEIKTKNFFAILKNLKLKSKKIKDSAKNILVILPQKNEVISKSIHNIENCAVTTAGSLNVYEVLKAQSLVMPLQSLEVIEKTFLK